jgi:SET domain-containing protein
VKSRRTATKNRPPHYRVYARLRPSKIHGIGVFAIRKIRKGTYIFYGDDDNMAWIHKPNLRNLPGEIRRLYGDFAVIKENGTLYGCPKNFNVLTVGWYLNCSKNPNVGCNIEGGYDFYALREINPGEELTLDYKTFSELPRPK